MSSSASGLFAPVLVVLASLAVPANAAEAVPDKPLTRDLVRRALMDSCVYGLNARQEVDKVKLVDGCQCAANVFMKDVKDADYATLTELPAAWIQTVQEKSGHCPK